MSSTFWPQRKQHVIRTVELHEPPGLHPELTVRLRKILSLANALRSLQDAGDDNLHLSSEIMKVIADHLSCASSHLIDDDSRHALGCIAEGLMGGESHKAMGSTLAGLDEKELVGYVGILSTWLGKSKKFFYSGFFGTPNQKLQIVSDVIDKYFLVGIDRLSNKLGVELKTVPGCAYKIIDLFGIAGEANSFPKHFAYFMPEDQGVKYSPVKRTIVFANTYKSLYQHIALAQVPIFGWDESALPALEEVDKYLISWFRGHDLGHSVVTEKTNYGVLSKCDRWGSMVVQETVADVFGFLLSMDHDVIATLQLDQDKMIRVYVLELFRYLRRGPRQFPDAGSAFIQLRMLEEYGVLTVTPEGKINIDCKKFSSGMVFIADMLVRNVMAGNAETFMWFIATYSPHLLDGQDLLFGLDECEISLGYQQGYLEVI